MHPAITHPSIHLPIRYHHPSIHTSTIHPFIITHPLYIYPSMHPSITFASCINYKSSSIHPPIHLSSIYPLSIIIQPFIYHPSIHHYPSIHVSIIHPFIIHHLYIHTSIHHPSIHTSFMHPSINYLPTIHPPIHLSIHPSVYPPFIHLSHFHNPSIHLSIHPSAPVLRMRHHYLRSWRRRSVSKWWTRMCLSIGLCLVDNLLNWNPDNMFVSGRKALRILFCNLSESFIFYWFYVNTEQVWGP